ncbi:hypothetical protein [uncultured Sphingomonas sp.]|uniref:plasmid mobilization protein n=1 Tax=uncultured Sphingomonas sp. TaxID=158754 RepID=UPI0035C97076
MATQAVETRSSRMVVLVSPTERRRITDNAREADMSISDFMRTAAQHYAEPTDAEALLLKDLVEELERANERTREAFEGVQEALERSRTYDEAAYKAQMRAELEARTDIDWDKMREFLGFSTEKAA